MIAKALFPILAVLLLAAPSLVGAGAPTVASFAGEGTLPLSTWASAAVWTGTKAYVIGGAEEGCYCPLRSIVEYDPVAKTTRVIGELPAGSAWGAAVWDGMHILYFGADYETDLGDMIVRIDPAARTVALDAPTSTDPAFKRGFIKSGSIAAVWHDEHAYLFASGSTYLTRYDPATQELTRVTLTQRLTGDVYSTLAWDGERAYVFGAGGDGSAILRVDPVLGAVETLDARAPSDISRAVFGNDGVYLFRARPWSWLTEVVDVARYDPATDTVAALDVILPYAPFAVSGVWTGTSAYLFGGMCIACPPGPLNPGADPLLTAAAASGMLFETNAILRFTPDA